MRSIGQCVLMVVLLLACCGPVAAQARLRPPSRPVSTYSIVARDRETGEMGVAVQSHWFSVGPVVAWAEAGVGAIATQALTNRDFGPDGLELLRRGLTAEEALGRLVAADGGRERRQLAIVDAHGKVAAHTGELCIAEAGHLVDVTHQFSVQANLMRSDETWKAMATAYRAAKGDLADRLLAALAAAEAVGGDIRGRQSAAILVVAPERQNKPWLDRRIDLRVEDHPQPVRELERLVRLHRAYASMDAGDAALEQEDFAAAARAFAEAERLAPEIAEIPFWIAVSYVNSGKTDEAMAYFRRAFADDAAWRELVPRLPAAKLLPDDPALIRRIQGVKSRAGAASEERAGE